MKKLFVFSMVLIAFFAGCAHNYYGKLISVKVTEDPQDEFQAAGYVVLAFENKNTARAEDWKWEFWVYYEQEKVFTYRLISRLVAGTRSYFLVEVLAGMRNETNANFPAQPNYERVKDRLISHLTERGTPVR